jgi:CspA family cold shock protein
MAAGIVRWWNESRGFGYVYPDGDDGDIRVDRYAITGPGYVSLSEGMRVTFDIVEGPKGREASNIQPA